MTEHKNHWIIHKPDDRINTVNPVLQYALRTAPFRVREDAGTLAPLSVNITCPPYRAFDTARNAPNDPPQRNDTTLDRANVHLGAAREGFAKMIRLSTGVKEARYWGKEGSERAWEEDIKRKMKACIQAKLSVGNTVTGMTPGYAWGYDWEEDAARAHPWWVVPNIIYEIEDYEIEE